VHPTRFVRRICDQAPKEHCQEVRPALPLLPVFPPLPACDGVLVPNAVGGVG